MGLKYCFLMTTSKEAVLLFLRVDNKNEDGLISFDEFVDCCCTRTAAGVTELQPYYTKYAKLSPSKGLTLQEFCAAIADVDKTAYKPLQNEFSGFLDSSGNVDIKKLELYMYHFHTHIPKGEVKDLLEFVNKLPKKDLTSVLTSLGMRTN